MLSNGSAVLVKAGSPVDVVSIGGGFVKMKIDGADFYTSTKNVKWVVD